MFWFNHIFQFQFFQDFLGLEKYFSICKLCDTKDLGTKTAIQTPQNCCNKNKLKQEARRDYTRGLYHYSQSFTFRLFDKDTHGFLTASQLERMMSTLSENHNLSQGWKGKYEKHKIRSFLHTTLDHQYKCITWIK